MIDLWPPLRRTFLVGLGHKARQGKDLAARAITDGFINARRIGFADAVRTLARLDYGMTTKDAPLLQRLGTEGRTADPDLWVRVVAWTVAEWEADSPEPQLVVIPDLRFPNEADWIKAWGGLCLELRRYGADGTRYLAADRDPTHLSEVALDGYPYGGIIDNVEARQEETRERMALLVEREYRRFVEGLS